MPDTHLFIGIDGGGTGCRARLSDSRGVVLGEGAAGPANTRLGLERVWVEIRSACEQALVAADLAQEVIHSLHAGLGLAGLTLPSEHQQFMAFPHPFATMVAATDVHIACLGAHQGADGGLLIIGTGSGGGGIVNGKAFTLGGWGFQLGDHGSGARLGLAAIRKALLAQENIIAMTDLCNSVMGKFDYSPEQAVLWADTALPKDYAEIVPLVFKYAQKNDPVAHQLLQQTAGEIVMLVRALAVRGVAKTALLGGLAEPIRPYLPKVLPLSNALGDALNGALLMAGLKTAKLPV